MIRPPGQRPTTAADPVTVAWFVVETRTGTTRTALRSRAAVRAAYRTARALEDAPGVRRVYVVSAFKRRR